MAGQTSLICFLAPEGSASVCSRPFDLFIPVTAQQNIARAIFLSGHVQPEPLCSGIGTCGRCRIRFLNAAPPACSEEYIFFSSKELQEGWRLGCRHTVHAPTRVELPETVSAQPFSPPMPLQHEEASPLFLGVDLGTTSIHWAFCDAKGTIKQQHTQINPQMGAGSDCIARLAAASTPEGCAMLRSLVQTALQRIYGLCKPSQVGGVCVAGNPSMTNIAFNKPLKGLTQAPYRIDYAGGKIEELPGMPGIWIPPQLAPFVGGDISAGFAWVEQTLAPQYPYILADMGTNGEFLLALGPEEIMVTSVALGPALEGTGLTFGALAGPCVVTDYSISPQGIDAHFYPPAEQAATAPHSSLPWGTGISGTGYLSLVQCLLHSGDLLETGQFAPTLSPLLAKHLKALKKPCSCPRCNMHRQPTPPKIPHIPLPHNLYLAASDIEEILKVKAAFSLGFSLLVQQAGITTADLKTIYLAGALGTHIAPATLERLGFVPKGAAARIHLAGNTSLMGACLLARSPAAQQHLLAAIRTVRSLPLAEQDNFSTQFANHMRFRWKPEEA